MAGGTYCAANGAGPTAWLAGCSAAVCGQSLFEGAAAAGAGGAVAILVHDAGREARDWHVVASGAIGIVRADAGARSRWKSCGFAVAADDGAERVNRTTLRQEVASGSCQQNLCRLLRIS